MTEEELHKAIEESKRKCEEELREGYKNIMEYLKENRDEYYNLPRKEKKQFKKLLDVLFPKEVRK